MPFNIKNLILPIFLICFASCAKEIYTDEDAANAKREAQKTALTVMIREVNNPTANVNGFVVSCLQLGNEVQNTTSTDGCTNLMLFKGDIVLTIEKEGYVKTMAIVTCNPAGTELISSVVVVPVIATNTTQGEINGTVTLPEGKPVSNALVSIEVEMKDLIASAFSGLGSELSKYQPDAIAYITSDLMLPIKTAASGAFSFKVPVTPTELAYTIRVHQTEIEQQYYTGRKVIVTDGLNKVPADIQLEIVK